MKIGIADMTSINGQLTLILTAENREDQMAIADLREKLVLVDLAARRLDPNGTGEELFVIPLDHLVATKKPMVKPLPDSGFRKVVDGLAGKK